MWAAARPSDGPGSLALREPLLWGMPELGCDSGMLLSGIKAELTCPLPLSPDSTDLAGVVVWQCYLMPAFPHWLPRLCFFSCKISAKPVVRMLSYSSIDKHASTAHSNPDFTCEKVLFVRGRYSTQVLKWPCLIYRPLQTLQGDD